MKIRKENLEREKEKKNKTRLSASLLFSAEHPVSPLL